MTLSKEKFEHILAYAKQQQQLGVHHCNILPDDMVAIMEMAAGKLERRERDGQEPVVYIRAAHKANGFCYSEGINCAKYHHSHPLSALPYEGDYWKVTPLYAAPPVPVVPTFEEWCQRTEQNPVGWVREAMKEAYEGCRAAMIKQPSSIQASDGAASGAEIKHPASNEGQS